MNRLPQRKFEGSVLAAGLLWGSTGFFTRSLTAMGLEPAGVVLIRCGFGALFFFLMLLIRDPGALRVRLKDGWIFLGSGIASLFFFTFCYFKAISLISLSQAAILLYTAPAIVMLLSAWLFGEKLTDRKMLALALALTGCVLVSGPGGGARTELPGILYGLGAGLGYALYSIFARCGLKRGYSSQTVNAWSCLLAALAGGLVFGVKGPLALMSSGKGLLLSAGTGLVTCFLPYALYTYGLSGMENGKASVLASTEPVVAALFGVLVYHEPMSLMLLGGMLLVLTAVVLLAKAVSIS